MCTGRRSPSWPPRASRSSPRAPRTAAGRWSCTAAPRPGARAARARRSRPSPRPRVDHVVVNAAGCGSAMKEYGDLLETDERAGLLGHGHAMSPSCSPSIEPRAPRGPVPMRVVYHDACHLAHAQGIRAQPRDLLRQIPGLELLEPGAEARDLLRLGRDLQPRPARGPRPSSGAARPASCSTAARRRSPPATPAAPPSWTCTCASSDSPLPIHHPIELLWRSIRAAAARG